MKQSLIAVSVFALFGIFTADVQAKKVENGLTATQIQACRRECGTVGSKMDLEASNLANKCTCEDGDGNTVNADDVDPEK